MSMQALAERIAGSGVSQHLQEQVWIVPVSQSIHIASIGIVFGSAVVLAARLLGFGKAGRPVSLLVRTLVPWMFRALMALAVTGLLQTLIEPVRQFVTPEFWWKMLMIVAALAMTAGLARAVRRDPQTWDNPETRPAIGKLFAVCSLALWLGIIICGRLIGYTWSLYVS